jgi:hypothetical protein
MSPKRCHVYLAAMDPATREHFIFECTAPAAEPFRDWIRNFNTLRGCLFQANRPKRRRNAKVEIQTKPTDLTKINLPQPPDIALAMTTIWRLPGTATTADAQSAMESNLTTDSDVCDRQRINLADFPLPHRKPNGQRVAS